MSSAKRTQGTYVLCVRNDGFTASLDTRKVYRAVADSVAEARGMTRVVDESGEDYLYPADCFVPIEVPASARSAFS